MASRPRNRPEEPPLFEDLAPVDSSDDDSSGLDRLVTRVSTRPRSWAMKWRPDESSSLVEEDADRHPARIGTSDAPEVGDSSSGNDDLPASSTESTTPSESDSNRPSPEPAILTSRTWDAAADTEGRHPRTPKPAPASGTSRPVASASRPVQKPRLRTRFAPAGWVVAVLLGLSWMATSFLPGPSDSVTSISSPGSEGEPVLARPTDEMLIESELLRDELGSMRDERARLMNEIDAAYLLLQDHRRLSRELQESNANNEGASIEVEGLAEDVRRWKRRHDVAVDRLDSMEQELIASDDREAELRRLVDALRERLRALDDSGGTD
jgi:hypothetical protein